MEADKLFDHALNSLPEAVVVAESRLGRLLDAADVNADTRLAVDLWLESPLFMGHFRVVAIAGERVRAATVDSASDADEAPVSSSMLNQHPPREASVMCAAKPFSVVGLAAVLDAVIGRGRRADFHEHTSPDVQSPGTAQP